MFPEVIRMVEPSMGVVSHYGAGYEHVEMDFSEMGLQIKKTYQIRFHVQQLINPTKRPLSQQEITGPIIDCVNSRLERYIDTKEVRIKRLFGGLYLTPDMVSDIKGSTFDNSFFYLTVQNQNKGFFNIDYLSKYNAEIICISYDNVERLVTIYIQTYEYSTYKNDKRIGPEEKRLKLKMNLMCKMVHRGRPVFPTSESEKRALETLREMISEKDYKSYRINGFISLKARDGKTYQIFKNKWHTKVYKDGSLIEEVCVRLSGNLPDTDNVVAFLTMLKTDPDLFRKSGNVYKFLAA